MRRASYQISIKIKAIFISVVLIFLANSGFSQSSDNGSFLNQTPPGNTPKIFPLSVNPGFFAAERIVISPDGRDIYYSEIKSYYPIKGENIKRYSFSEGKWTGPFNLFDGYAPTLSITGDTMYFERKDLSNNSEAYLVVKRGHDWSNPKRILSSLNKAHYFQDNGKGKLYISTKSGNTLGYNDWCRVEISGTDSSASSLGKPLNTPGDNLDYFVSRDESYMIVTNRPRLGISYRNSDGSWTEPRDFGKKINFGLGSWGPYVTTDNKYLFYSTGTKFDYSDVHVYWVSIDGVIDSMAPGR
jgi:hypothetical protein